MNIIIKIGKIMITQKAILKTVCILSGTYLIKVGVENVTKINIENKRTDLENKRIDTENKRIDSEIAIAQINAEIERKRIDSALCVCK